MCFQKKAHNQGLRQLIMTRPGTFAPEENKFWKILAELDGKIAELSQDFGPVRLYLQGFCLILAQLGYFCKVFV